MRLPLSTLAVLTFLLTSVPCQAWEMTVCAESDHLPYSNANGEGFENRIAEILAGELEAKLSWVWLSRSDPVPRGALMRRGECDIVMGITDGQRGLLTTLAYYRSTYVFVYRNNAEFQVNSLDDPILAKLRIGVPFHARSASPPTLALANRSLTANIEFFFPLRNDKRPLAGPIEAVAAGDIHLAIVWGPIAGYFVKQLALPITVVPITPEIDVPFLPMAFPITLGVRPGDVALRDRLNLALARRWDDIQAVLKDYAIPLLPLPRPSVGTVIR